MNLKGKPGTIAEALLAQIENGNLPRGSLVSSERRLALDFGVSHMTARKAVDALVAEGYFERRPGSGTFVRADLDERKASRQLGIVLPAWEAPEVDDFVIHASRVAAQAGWLPRVHYSRFWADKAVESAVESSDALMFLPPERLDKMPATLKERLLKKAPPSVVVGLPAYAIGLDSVNSQNGMPLAVEHLIKAGHKRIAIALQDFSGDEELMPYEVFIDSWRELVEPLAGRKAMESLLIQAKVPQFELPHGSLKKAIKDAFKRGKGKLPFTAIVVPLSMAWGALSAFHELGLDVPGDVSAVFTGDRQEAEFYAPKLSMVRISTRLHVEKAWEILQARMKDKSPGPMSRTTRPEFVKGETVARLKREG